MKKKHKIIEGGFYLTLVNILTQILAVGVNIILARLLLPENFGLIALATTYIGFITLFTNIGFGSSIIYEQNSTQQQLSSIYWLNLVISVVSFLLIIISVPFASKFYNEPKLSSVVWFASLSVLLSPFFIIHYKIKERDLEFKLLSKVNLISTISGSIAAVIGAVIGIGVYALVLQMLVSTFVRLIIIHIVSTWNPSFEFNFASIKSMIWYSMKYKASTAVLFLERNVDYLILGRIFSSNILGYYAFAYNIMYTPVKRISYIFSDVLFPSFSSIKNDKRKIISSYFKSIQLIALISFPAMTILSFNAEIIIHTVFGNKWDNAIPIVQILCFAGMIQSISQFGSVIFFSIGKPEASSYVSIGRTILTVMAILLGTLQGILMVAYFIVIAKTLSFVLFLGVLFYYIPFSFYQLAKYLAGPVFSVLSLIAIQLMFNNKTLPYTGNIAKLVLMLFVSLVLLITFHYKVIMDIFLVLKQKVTG